MKKRKMLLIFLALLLGVVLSNNAYATGKFYTVTISQLANGWGGQSYACLSDTATPPSFTDMWFYVTVGAREQMALLMLAMSNDMKVQIFGDPTAPGAGLSFVSIYK